MAFLTSLDDASKPLAVVLAIAGVAHTNASHQPLFGHQCRTSYSVGVASRCIEI
jgi:hypothetical protein